MMENEKRDSRKALYMALAILVAIVMWLYVNLAGVNGGPRTTTQWYNDIPIEYIHQEVLTEKGLMLLEENTDATVDLKVEGTYWTLANLDKEDIRVTVDLSSVALSGKQMIAYSYSFSSSKSGESLRVKERTPSSAYVNVAELFRKSVDVYCEVVGNVASGCYAGQLQMSHTELEIRGQQSDVEPVAYAKVVLDIGEDVGTTVSKSLKYEFYDAEDNLVESTGIHASVDEIQVTLPVSINKELTLAMNFIDAPGIRVQSCDYNIQPSTVTVSGDAQQLRYVNEIVLNDFDLTTLTSEPGTYSYPIVIPDGCKNLSGITQAILQISRRDYTEYTLPVTNFEFQNLPDGKHVEVMSEELSVRVFGTVNDVAGLMSEHLTAVVELGEFTGAAGTYTVPVILESSYGDIGFAGEYEVQVRIYADDDATNEVPVQSEDTREP